MSAHQQGLFNAPAHEAGPAAHSVTEKLLATAAKPHSDDFDWTGDAEDVVIKHQPGIACYWNPRGEIVIRQDGGPMDDDSFIYVQPANVLALIDKLKEMERGQ